MTPFASAITPSIRAGRHGHLTAHPRRSEPARGRVGGAKVTGAWPIVVARAKVSAVGEQLCGRMTIFNRERSDCPPHPPPPFRAFQCRAQSVNLMSACAHSPPHRSPPAPLAIHFPRFSSGGGRSSGPFRDLHRARESPLPALLAHTVCALA